MEREQKFNPVFQAWDVLKLHRKIGIDIDGVLMDFVKVWTDELNSRFKGGYRAEDVTDWEFEKSLGLSRQMTQMIWNSRGLLERMKKAEPYSLGKELCNLLSLTGKELHYVTSRGMSGVDSQSKQALARLTNEWLADNDFPFGSVSFWGDKAEVAEHWGLTAFVEDSPSNALQLAERGLGVVLIDQPYNRGVGHELIHRVEDWV